MRKLLIADSSEIFCKTLSDLTGGAFEVRTCTDGNDAVSLIKSFLPDIVCLDLMLPGQDGIRVLELVEKVECYPVVLATTQYISEYTLQSLKMHGVSYVMMKPCSLSAVVARLSDLSRLEAALPNGHYQDVHTAEEILALLHVRSKLKGYRYISIATSFMMDDPGLAITKVVYPTVAAKCASSASCVERAIRSAIEDAWENRDNRIWNVYFPNNVAHGQCPTNREFLSRIATYLMTENCDLEFNNKACLYKKILHA